MPPGTFSERKTIMKSEGRTLSVSEVMDGRPLGRFQTWTILLCGLVIIFDGFDTQSIGILAPSMSETLNIPLKYFGTILSAALFGLLIASLVMGPVADRWGRKWVLVISVFTFALFMTMTARATSLRGTRDFAIPDGARTRRRDPQRDFSGLRVCAEASGSNRRRPHHGRDAAGPGAGRPGRLAAAAHKAGDGGRFSISGEFCRSW